TYEYLQRLAQQVQREFGVLPEVTQVADFKADRDLESLKGIGKARGPGGMPFATYATWYAEPFVDASQKNAPVVLQIHQPSQPISNWDRDVFIFRITETKLSQMPVERSEVAEKVESDAKLAAGYTTARDAADRLIAAARGSAGSLEAAARNANRTVI